MSKYEQFQQLFLDYRQSHKSDADDCFDAIADLTQQLVDYSGWYSDDVEFISLNPSIAPQKPQQILRFKRSGRNRERIREVAIWTGSFWSLGIRFRLRPQVSEPFQPREIMFVLPILVKKDPVGNLTIQVDSARTAYGTDEFEPLTELVFQHIQTVLEQRIQHLIGETSQAEVWQDLGFVIKSERLQALNIKTEKTVEYESSQSISAPMIEVVEEVVEAVMEPVSESVAEFTEPLPTESIVEPVTEPVAETVVQPTVELTVAPLKQPARSHAKAAKQPTVTATKTSRSRTKNQ